MRATRLPGNSPTFSMKRFSRSSNVTETNVIEKRHEKEERMTTRRTMLAAGASLGAAAMHGAWHGGWCWRRVSDLLEQKGHKVFTPTLTGLGERSHLMSRDINLDTHISDVVNVIKWE